jgi:hypothetical protein
MNILTLFLINVLIYTRQFLVETLAAAAQLDSERRSLFGTASSLSVQPLARSSHLKMQADRIEVMSTSEQSRETVNLQASSSAPPTKLPARIRILKAYPNIPIDVIAPASGSGAPTILTSAVVGVSQVTADSLM